MVMEITKEGEGKTFAQRNEVLKDNERYSRLFKHQPFLHIVLQGLITTDKQPVQCFLYIYI